MPLLGAGALAKKLSNRCRRRDRIVPSRSRVSAPASGFASVDALVALTILTATLALVLQNAHTAKKLAAAADEMRAAQSMGQYLLETGELTPGLRTGRSGGFKWSLQVDASTVANNTQTRICGRKAAITAEASGRHYDFSSAAPCPSIAAT